MHVKRTPCFVIVWARPFPYSGGVSGWTFLSNHGHVLTCLNADETLRVRDIAEQVGITERAVVRILGELVEGGYLEKFRDGRRNTYRILRDKPLRHALESGHTVGDLLDAVAPR